MSNLQELSVAFAAIWVALGILWLIFKKVRAKTRVVASKFNSATETILGREEILHPDTGHVIVPATPSLGQRIGGLEQTIVTLVETQTQVADLHQKVDTMSMAFHNHVNQSDESQKLRLEEQTAMWNAINAVAQSTPKETA